MQGRAKDQQELLDAELVVGHLMKPGSLFAFLALQRPQHDHRRHHLRRHRRTAPTRREQVGEHLIRDQRLAVPPARKATKMTDQHTFVILHGDLKLRPGDIVTLGMSHPCTAFDKCRFLPVVDDDANVVDAVLTFF